MTGISQTFSFGTKINNNSSINLSGSVLRSDTYRDAAEFSNENIVLNYQNKFEDLVFNIDIFSSSRDQDLPGPRVKGGAVYNYHFVIVMKIVKQQNILEVIMMLMEIIVIPLKEMTIQTMKTIGLMHIEYKLDVESKLYLNLGYKKAR